jgi:hypothetical protein
MNDAKKEKRRANVEAVIKDAIEFNKRLGLDASIIPSKLELLAAMNVAGYFDNVTKKIDGLGSLNEHYLSVLVDQNTQLIEQNKASLDSQHTIISNQHHSDERMGALLQMISDWIESLPHDKGLVDG